MLPDLAHGAPPRNSVPDGLASCAPGGHHFRARSMEAAVFASADGRSVARARPPPCCPQVLRCSKHFRLLAQVSKPKKAAAAGDKPKKTVKKSTTAPKKASKPKVGPVYHVFFDLHSVCRKTNMPFSPPSITYRPAQPRRLEPVFALRIPLCRRPVPA